MDLPLLKSNGDFNFILFETGDLSIDTIKSNYDYLLPIYEKYSSKDSVAIDIGAFIGSHSLVMSKLFKKVYTFEPQKYLFYNVCANLYINKILNVSVFNNACYSDFCKMKLNPEKQTHKTGFVGQDFNYWNDSGAACLGLDSDVLGDIEAIPIDSLNIQDKVNIIKCDAQGSDLQALIGCAELINKNKPVIIFEYEPILSEYHNNSFDDYINFLSQFGYKCSKILEHANDYLCIA